MNVVDRHETFLAPPQSGGPSSDVLDVGGLFAIVWRGKWLVILCFVTSVVLTYGVLQRIAPTFFGSATLLLDGRQENWTNTRNVVSDLSLTSSVVAGELALIRSNVLIGKVVDHLDLVNHPEFDPTIERPPSLFAQAKQTVRGVIGVVVGAGKEASSAVPDGPPSEDEQAHLLRTEVIQAVQSRLSVSQSGIAYAINVGFTSKDPQTAAAVANAVAERYILDQIEAKRAAAFRASVWLNERVERLKEQVEAAEAAVVAFRADQSQAGGGEDTIAQQLGELNRELMRARSDLVTAKARHNEVVALTEEGGAVAASIGISSPLTLTLSQQRSELRRRRAEAAKWYGANHPNMVALDAELEDIERAIEAEIRKAVAGLKTEVDVQVARVEQLTSDLSVLEDRMVDLSMSSIKLRQLERFANATRSVYENFLARYKETTEQAQLERSNARVISVAEVPTWPSKPRKKLLVAAAGVFGAAIGLAAVFLVALTSTRIHDPLEVPRKLRIPLLAALPRAPGSNRRGWLARQLTRRPATPFAEAVRGLRAALSKPSPPMKSVVLLVTSAEPSQGKTVTAVALAHVFAAIGRPTVVVDCDLRRPGLDTVLPRAGRIHKRKTLADHLRAEVALDEVLATDRTLGIDYVGAVKNTDNSADLLASQPFEQMVEDLREAYDIVILDGPPVLVASDALVLSRHADWTLLVARSGRARLPATQAAAERLGRADAKIAGAVVTGISVRWMGRLRKGAEAYG